VALIKGMLVSYSSPLLGAIPTIVAFQYNPTEVTRVFRLEKDQPSGSGSARNTREHAVEEYTLKLELDATDGLEREGPLTLTMGISPRLAAIEMLMQPVGTSLLGGLLSEGSPPATGKLPLVLFAWGPERITPVVLKSLTIHETAFDELLNPIHATADLGFTVLRVSDVPRKDELARAAALYYEGAREAKAVLQLAQIPELAEVPLTFGALP
jgi:hypothetical protein